jgi:hypothetical protein
VESKAEMRNNRNAETIVEILSLYQPFTDNKSSCGNSSFHQVEIRQLHDPVTRQMQLHSSVSDIAQFEQPKVRTQLELTSL